MKKLMLVMMWILSLFVVFAFPSCSSSSKKNVIQEVYNQPIYIVKNLSEMSSGEIPSAKVETAWQDQFGNKYFIFFLGRIELAEIYNLASFQYNGQDQKITQKKVDNETVISTIKNSVSKMVTWSEEESVENELKLSAGLTYGISQAGVEDTFTTAYKATWGETILTEDSSELTTITTKINELMVETDLNCEKVCTIGKFYRYSVCADINCFMQLYVPAVSGEEASYNFYSQIVDPTKTFDMLIERDSHKDFSTNTGFEIPEVDLKKIDCSKVIPVYTPITETYKLFGSWELEYKLTEDDDVNVYIDISKIYEETVKWGYDRIRIDYKVYSKGTSNTSVFAWLNSQEGKSYSIHEWVEETAKKGKMHSHSVDVDISVFSGEKKVWFFFEYRNDVPFTGVTLSDIEMTVTIYKGN